MNRIGKPRRTKSSTIAGVASVEPESTTTMSAQSRSLFTHLPMQAASLRQITAALKARAPPGARGSEGCAGDRVAGSVRAISPCVRAADVHLPSEGPRESGGYLGQLSEAGKFRGRPVLAAAPPRDHPCDAVRPSPY